MESLINTLATINWLQLVSSSTSSFFLIFSAEIGDKSQLVCMALAARYKAASVILGSILAFLLLNTLAVIFGNTIANFLPDIVILAAVAVLFLAFGIAALTVDEQDQDDKISISGYGSIVLATFLLITVAEFGDKTQLAVVALSSSQPPLAVWLGSNLALISTSILAVWLGRTLLQKLSIRLFQRISGVIFIILALFASYKLLVTF